MTQDELFIVIAKKNGWVFGPEAAAVFHVTKVLFTKPNGKPGHKTVGEGEYSFVLHTGLPVECMQGARQPFDILTPFGKGEGKKEGQRKVQPNAVGRRAKQDFEADLNTRAGEKHGADFALDHVYGAYKSRESITPDFLKDEIQPYLPNVLEMLENHTKPSIVFSDVDFVLVFFSRKGVSGFIPVVAAEYDRAFEFHSFTRGSATYRLRLEWLEGLLVDESPVPVQSV